MFMSRRYVAVARFLMALGLVSLSLTLAACVPAQPESEQAAEAETTDIIVTTIPGAPANNLQYCAEKFAEVNPNISVQIDIAGGAEQVYKPNFPQIAISSDRPDAAWYWVDGRQYQDLVEAGALEPLNDIWESEGLYDAYPEATVTKYTSPDGNQYAVNEDIVWYPVTYYNKAIFEEVGVAPPANGIYYESLEEWYDVVDKFRAAGYEPLTIGGGEGWRLGHLHDTLLQRMIPQELLNDFYNNWRPGWEPKAHYDGPEWQAVDAMMKEWYDRGVIAEGDLGRNYAEGRALFVQNKAAMYQGGSWDVAILRDEAPDLDFGWMLNPQILPEIDPAFLLYAGDGYLIPKAKSPESLVAAKEFIGYCVSLEYQTAMVENSTLGRIGGRIDIPAESMQEMDPMILEMFQKITEVGTSTGWDDPVPADLAEKSFILMQEMLTDVRDSATVGEELEAMAERRREK